MITIIVYALTYVITLGEIVRLGLEKVIKSGRAFVALSLTTETLVVAPISGSII
jgi:hypothetical protein